MQRQLTVLSSSAAASRTSHHTFSKPFKPFKPLAHSAIAAATLACCAAAAQTTLPSVEVTEPAERVGLRLQQAGTTGTRTGLAVREAPMSVGGVSDLQLQERGDTAVTEAITRTVGLTAAGSPGNGGLAFSSRGFEGTNSVAVAEDGVAAGVAAGTISYPSDTWGYERMEVLRGPASLMYGSGTVGATINAVRKAPSRERTTEVLLAGGTKEAARVGVGATGPLGESASYRIDAYGSQADGDRALSLSQSGKFMGTLRLQPRADLQIDLVADRATQEPARYWGTPVVNGRVATELAGENYNASDSIIRYEDTRLRAKVQWQASDTLTLRNETYYFKTNRHWRNIEAYSFNPAAGTVTRSDYLEILHHLEQTGNNVSAAGRSGAHRWVVGWDAVRSSFTHTNNAPYGGTSTVSAIHPVHGTWASPDATLPKYDTGLTQHAVYAEDAWTLAPQWLALLGLRHDAYRYDRQELQAGTRFDKQMGGTSARGGLTYRWDERTSVYAQVSTGYDPVTALISLNLANRDFQLSRGTQTEVGIKQSIQQGLGEWTLAVFNIDKKNIVTRDPSRTSVSVQGGQQSSRGVEWTAVVQATRTLRLEGNLALVDAQFDTLLEAGGNRAGNRPANVPRQSANLWAHYRTGAWQLSSGLRHVGQRFADNANSVQLPAYTLWDAAVHYQVSPQATVSLVARNLADRRYVSASYGDNQFLLGQGRRLELAAHWRF